ncbi:MAG: hypothetical protein AAF191_07680 [Verrucomicrobiota bacterium]
MSNHIGDRPVQRVLAYGATLLWVGAFFAVFVVLAVGPLLLRNAEAQEVAEGPQRSQQEKVAETFQGIVSGAKTESVSPMVVPGSPAAMAAMQAPPAPAPPSSGDQADGDQKADPKDSPAPTPKGKKGKGKGKGAKAPAEPAN